MTRSRLPSARAPLQTASCIVILLSLAISANAQTAIERTFPASKSTVEKALKQLQSSMRGRLPALEGFTLVGDHPLSRYQRAFYQCIAQVTALPTGGSLVRMTAKVTAWYSDTNASRSGYQLLLSNGRLEADLLDQLSDQLSSSSYRATASPDNKPSSQTSAVHPQVKANDEPTLTAPMPNSTETGSAFSSSPSKGGLAPTPTRPQPNDAGPSQNGSADVRTEVASLEEVLKNQAHPKNLVAVKKSGTPVLASPSLSGKTLFMASAHDEFEMLDFNADWVHVRISGLSRGWIWRTSLEMPEGISDVPQAVSATALSAADLFQVSREEIAQFPGDWEPLRGKSVRIISVQKIRENEQGGGARAKLEFAKSVLDKSYDELAKSPDLSGLVLIFDSVDGGMIAATVPTIRRWKAGGLTDAALWHQCYFDPPETFSVSSGTGSP